MAGIDRPPASGGFPDPGAVMDGCGSDLELLIRLRSLIEEGDRWLGDAREIRDAAAFRLRSIGVPMTEIARVAGVSDSYLTRRALAVGHPPRRRPRAEASDAEASA